MRDEDERLEAQDDALLAAIVRGANDAIICTDPAGIILSWNGGATRLFGYAASEMIGQPVDCIMPDGSRAALERALKPVLAGESAATFRTSCATAESKAIAVSVSLSPVRASDGAIVAVSAILRERASPGAARADTLADHVLADDSDALGAGVRNILIVEDEALIGLGLHAMLENAGFDVIGPAADVFSALDLIDRHGCALAILDIKLRSGETSAPLALWLKREGIPFFVTSGNLRDAPHAIFGDAPSFPKPVRARAIVSAVQEALRQ